jgi:hypothetical protein
MTVQPQSTPWSAVPAPRGGPVPWWRRRRQEREQAEATRYLGWQWQDTALGAGLVRRTESAAGIPHVSMPELVRVDVGPPVTLVVRMLPGQLIDDYRKQAHRIAEGMGVAMVRVSPGHIGWVRLGLLVRDPLTTPMPLPRRPAGMSVLVPLLLGVDEFGRPVTVDLATRTHVIVQGRTGSGKSRLAYAVLQQLAAAPDAVIAGSDPSSVLLRPFTGSRHARWQVLGNDVQAHADLLDRLVAEMGRRLALIPPRSDELPLTSENRMLVVVLEEWLALLGLAGSNRKLRERLAVAVRGLAAEGGKVNVRVLMLPQRAEASEVGGGLLRGQFAYRVTLPVDNVDAVRLLHPSATVPEAEAHVRAGVPGIALVDAPGRELGRLRTLWMPDYGTYWDAITTLTATEELS